MSISPMKSAVPRGLALALTGLLVWTLWLAAAPFAKVIKYTQPDGTRIELWGQGDEFYAVFEALDGFAVVFDQTVQAYCYARLAPDGGSLLSTGQWVGQANPATLGLAPHLRISPEARRAQVQVRRLNWDPGMETESRWADLKAAAHARQQALDTNILAAPPSSPTVGLRVGLTLVVDFSDVPGTLPQAEIVNYLNGDNYSGFGNNGSVKKYYQDVSNGRLTYTNIVTVYLRMPRPKSYYNNVRVDCGIAGNALVADAVNTLKSLPNYTTQILPLLDNLSVDGDNNVMCCNLFFAGANSGVWTAGLWPHQWWLYLAGPQSLSPGGKKIWIYQITDIGNSLAIGTFCHENGHMMCGFPDLYDYNYDSTGGAGFFCLMNSGAVENDPVQVCAYLKLAAGWATPVDINANSSLLGVLTAARGTNFNVFYRCFKPGVRTEYFLLENRQQTGHDALLPGAGIAIWHVDELGDRDNQSLVPNTRHANYELTLVQADNLWDFENYVNDGDTSDLYYQGNPAPAYANRFSDTTFPNAHWWDGSNSGLLLTKISALGPTMTFACGPGIPPTILVQPTNATVYLGGTATFTVGATGSPILRYQWRKNGVNLSDGGRITGATNATLVLSGVQAGDAGTYTVVVSNPFGSVLSTFAVLTVAAVPGISLQPQSQWAEVGATVQFLVQAGGSGPLTYQWRKDGVFVGSGGRLSGSSSNLFTIAGVTADDAGTYTVTVSNPYGSTASDGATLVVLPPGGGLTIASTNGWDGLTCRYPFGETNTATYGQTFVAPTASRLLSFTLFLAPSNDPGSVDFKFYVMAWDGAKATGAVLYASQATNTAGRLGVQAYSFQPDSLSLVAGATYVAFLSAQFDGIIGHAGAGANAGGYPAGHFVYLDNGSDFSKVTTTAWSGMADLDLAFVANFEGPRVPPRLDTQPVSRDVLAGSTVSFSLAASGSAPLSYQWRKGGANLADGGRLSGATGTLLAVTAVDTSDAGDYTVVVTNAFGSVTSLVATLTLRAGSTLGPDAYGYMAADNACIFEDVSATGLQILVNADDLTATASLGFAFSFYGLSFSDVSVSANGLLTFGRANSQSDNVDFGNTSPAVNVPHLAPFWGDLITGTDGVYCQTLGDPGNRRFVVQWQNVSGYSPSTIDHRSPMSITFEVVLYEQTGDILVQYGSLETGDVRARGGLATVGIRDTDGQSNGRTLQWSYNQSNLFNGQAIRFYLSTTAVPPSITTQPKGQVVVAGTSATNTVVAVGPDPLSYQWSKDGTTLAGATNASLVLTNVQRGDDGTYTVVVSNPNGSVSSLPAPLFVVEAPQILTQPFSQTNVVGTTANFSVLAVGSNPMGAQWRKDGVNLPGATGTQCIVPNVQTADAGGYSVVLANQYGAVTSFVAMLSVVQTPSLLTQPQSQKALAGDSVTFSVVAAGTPPFSYQWLKDGVPLSGGGANYALTSVQPADAGGYRVVVANAYGAVTSLVATLSVRVATQIGPDAFGYQANDNLTFAFEDISATARRILVNADDSAASADLGFNFSFYGASFSNVYVSANGLLTFVTPSLQNMNVNFSNAVPQVDVPHIAPFWDDLVTGTNGVYCQTLGSPGSRRFVALWKDVRGFGSINPMTFEATLYEGGNDLVFQYLNVDSGDVRAKGGQATVGIRATRGQATGRVLQWSCDQPALQNGQAIHFFLPSPVVPLRFEDVRWLSDGTLFLQWTGTPGQINFLKVSSNLRLQKWIPVATVTNVTGRVSLIFTNTSVSPEFFRLEQP